MKKGILKNIVDGVYDITHKYEGLSKYEKYMEKKGVEADWFLGDVIDNCVDKKEMKKAFDKPSAIRELIDKHWTMDQDEYEEKYGALTDNDRSFVASVIEEMGRRFLNGDFDNDDEQ